MKLLASLGIVLGVAGAQCFAADLSGRLMDADCYNQQKVASQDAGHKTYHSITKTCAANASSTAFALRVMSGQYGQWEGETLMLDDNGNSMAEQALKAGTLRPGKEGVVKVSVRGKVTDDENLITHSIESHGHVISSPVS